MGAENAKTEALIHLISELRAGWPKPFGRKCLDSPQELLDDLWAKMIGIGIAPLPPSQELPPIYPSDFWSENQSVGNVWRRFHDALTLAENAVREETNVLLDPILPECRPTWNKDTGELRLEGKVIRRIRNLNQAKNIVSILDAFQEDGWPARIDDPIPPRKNPLAIHDALKRLNNGLGTIRFRADGTTEGIVWERKIDSLGQNKSRPEGDLKATLDVSLDYGYSWAVDTGSRPFSFLVRGCAMIDINSEHLLTITQAAKTTPGRPHVSTIWRWINRGVRGVKLETVLLGGRRFTSHEARRQQRRTLPTHQHHRATIERPNSTKWNLNWLDMESEIGTKRYEQATQGKKVGQENDGRTRRSGELGVGLRLAVPHLRLG